MQTTTITIRPGYQPVTIGRGTKVHVALGTRTLCGTAANNPRATVRRHVSAGVNCTKCLSSEGVSVVQS